MVERKHGHLDYNYLFATKIALLRMFSKMRNVSLMLVVASLIICNESNQYCIWGRSDPNNFNTILNGQYTYDGDLNGHSSYSKTTDENCSSSNSRTLYLWYSNSGNYWAVGDTKGVNSFNAYCEQTDLSSCTQGNWKMYDGSAFVVEPNIYAQSGECPQVLLL